MEDEVDISVSVLSCDLHVRIKKSVTSSSSSSSSVLLAPMTSIARHGILYEEL